ncbi:MAG: site-specific recombinase, phage integrase family protein [Verrucomicrobiaceae bacterium]|nr:site-specific recombinase, phage integrase family protein [Verrucomicrobiaceae bacterium]
MQTVNTYASQLSVFCNYLSLKQATFFEVDDGVLYEFRNWLEGEPHRRYDFQRKRAGRQINKLIGRAISFLTWYQRFRLPEEQILVGSHFMNPLIVVEERKLQKKGRVSRYLWHGSMAPRDVPKDVLPMGRTIFLQLLDACDQLAKSRYVQLRMRVLLGILADTGCRRSEASMLTVNDILQAKDSGRLVLRTAKRVDEFLRLVPVPEATVDAALSFIETQRAMLVNRLLSLGIISEEPQWLFLTIRGEILNSETITQDIARLRKTAHIAQPATAHMLRHRWITIQVAERFRAYQDRKIPIDITTTILTNVASLTGHKSIDSLWGYVDLAFNEIGIWNAVDAKLSHRFEADALFRTLQSLCSSVRNTDSVDPEVSAQISDVTLRYMEALAKVSVES